jgi:hypothetical protein
MKKIIKLVFISFMLLFALTAIYAEEPKVNIAMTTNELAFSLNLLSTIDLTGEEVGPFLDIKNMLTGAYKDASSSKKGSADVNLLLPAAKNFVFFMQRVKLKGADASLFYDLNKKIVDSIKKVSKS